MDKSKLVSIEQTFMMIKPDGIRRGLVGEIMSRMERVGLKLVASRMIMATREQAEGNYPGSEAWLTGMGQKTYDSYSGDEKAINADLGTTDKLEIGKKIYAGLVNYLTESPVILMVWEGNHAVLVAQRIVGKTNPTVADIGTIRADYGYDTPMLAVKAGRIVFQNLVHISDAADEAKREIAHWFGKEYAYLGNYERVDYIGAY